MSTKSTAVIGLTGGIASGKSTVARRWRERGARVIDADVLARAVVAPGEPALAAIAATFGPDYLREDGTLDRNRLGALVFRDPRARDKLNALTHPAILRRVGGELMQARAAGWPWVVYEAALIIENELTPGLAGLVAVVCAPDAQVARMRSRDGLVEADARARMSAQTDDATRREAADWVLDNDGTIAELVARADALFDELVARYGQVPAPAATIAPG